MTASNTRRPIVCLLTAAETSPSVSRRLAAGARARGEARQRTLACPRSGTSCPCSPLTLTMAEAEWNVMVSKLPYLTQS